MRAFKNSKLRIKKFIFILFGVFAIGIVTTIIILLVNTQSSKQEIKIKIDEIKLKTNSFKISGSQNRGTINLKDDFKLPKGAELRYFVGSSPASDEEYTTNKPTNLKNGDVTYIKLFIKSDAITHTSSTTSSHKPIRFVVGGLKTLINSDFLKASSFKLRGYNGLSDLKLKSSINLPNEVEVKYLKKDRLSLDGTFIDEFPINLSNGDIIHIKFIIKNSFIWTHKFLKDFTNPIRFEVSGLKNYIWDGKMSSESFEFQKGNRMSIQWRPDIDLNEKVRLGYHITTNPFDPNYRPSDSDYNMGPQSFYDKENSIIYAKFFIKNQFKHNHEFIHEFQDTIIFKNISPPYLVSSEESTIFQDSWNNLWLLAKDSKLQVLAWNDEIKQYASSWVDSTASGLTKNSKITNGQGGVIFQDSQNNLWAMGKDSKLQVLIQNTKTKQYASSWTSDNTKGLLKGSNITNGQGGVIFQDSSRNLWAMGKGSRLQVLAWNDETLSYVNNWTNDTSIGLTKGLKITDGEGGVIFEDSYDNLWAMGKGSRLQVLAWDYQNTKYASSWNGDTSRLLNNSKITNGKGGIIFQDSQYNLWAMGKGSKLQVLPWNNQTKHYASAWLDSTNNGLTKYSQIIDGEGGAIFQDSQNNLWAMGKGSKLQVLAWDDEKMQYVSFWNSYTGGKLTKGSKIINGAYGIIFQDFSGNLWAMGSNSKLQVLVWNDDTKQYASSWTNDISNRLLDNLDVTNGKGGTIFQDNHKNIWLGSYKKPLQVFDQKRQKWIQPSKPTIP